MIAVFLVMNGCKSSGSNTSNNLASAKDGFKDEILLECQVASASKLLRIYTSNNPSRKMFVRIYSAKSENSKTEYESNVVATPIDDPAYNEFDSIHLAEWHFTVFRRPGGFATKKFAGSIWSPKKKILNQPPRFSIQEENALGQGKEYSLQHYLEACKITDKAKLDKMMDDAGIF